MQSKDSSGSNPSAPTTLLVIGAAPSRTGTTSMKAALEQLLGGRCMHFSEMMRRGMTDIPIWLAAAKRGRLEKSEAVQVLAGFCACVDFPAALFYKDLMEYYPQAKVLLTVRDERSWAASIRSTVMNSVV